MPEIFMELRPILRWNLLTALVLASFLELLQCQLTSDPDKLLNWCLDTVTHKQEPGPEDELHGQCTPWKDKACCTRNATIDVHSGNMYNFDIDHCKQVKPMSDACRTHFIQDHCFFECEPHIGPWVVEVEMVTRKERFFNVPLCSRACDEWFDDCKDDFTCTDNWMRKFDWKNGKNVCPPGSECRTFRQMYNNASNFCEVVFDHSWVYTTEDKPCMTMWFQGPNPNEKVARNHIAELEKTWSNSGNSHSQSHGPYLGTLIAIFTFILSRW